MEKFGFWRLTGSKVWVIIDQSESICNLILLDVYGEWGDWNQWSDCSSTEISYRTRTRSCDCVNCTVFCGGKSKEKEFCPKLAKPEVQPEVKQWSRPDKAMPYKTVTNLGMTHLIFSTNQKPEIFLRISKLPIGQLLQQCQLCWNWDSLWTRWERASPSKE